MAPFDTNNTKKSEMIKSSIKSAKSDEVIDGLLKKLQNKYTIKTYLSE